MCYLIPSWMSSRALEAQFNWLNQTNINVFSSRLSERVTMSSLRLYVNIVMEESCISLPSLPQIVSPCEKTVCRETNLLAFELFLPTNPLF